MSKDDKSFHGIPIVQNEPGAKSEPTASGQKFKTKAGFSAVKNGQKNRRGSAPLVRGDKPKWLRAKMPSGSGYSGTRTDSDRRAKFFAALFFMLGTTIALVILGYVAGFIGQVCRMTMVTRVTPALSKKSSMPKDRLALRMDNDASAKPSPDPSPMAAARFHSRPRIELLST